MRPYLEIIQELLSNNNFIQFLSIFAYSAHMQYNFDRKFLCLTQNKNAKNLFDLFQFD